MKPKYTVIIPRRLKPLPSEEELSVAWLLAEYFQTDVEFVVRGIHKSADYLIEHQFWELKSLTGNGKRTIQHALNRAKHQSPNIVIDARYIKLNINTVCARLRHELRENKQVKRLILVGKVNKVVELFR